MKLHWSPRSPFVRKVMIVAHETGLAERIELVRSVAAMTTTNPAIMADNPLNKLPTLVLDDGRPVFDSLVICEYLDGLHTGPKLFPSDPDARLDALVRHALASGLLDGLILWRNDLNRPPEFHFQPFLKAIQIKVEAALDRLETLVPQFEALPFDIGHAATGCACGYLDFRFGHFDWREGRPRLAAWHKAFEARPSALKAVVVAD